MPGWQEFCIQSFICLFFQRKTIFREFTFVSFLSHWYIKTHISLISIRYFPVCGYPCFHDDCYGTLNTVCEGQSGLSPHEAVSPLTPCFSFTYLSCLLNPYGASASGPFTKGWTLAGTHLGSIISNIMQPQVSQLNFLTRCYNIYPFFVDLNVRKSILHPVSTQQIRTLGMDFGIFLALQTDLGPVIYFCIFSLPIFNYFIDITFPKIKDLDLCVSTGLLLYPNTQQYVGYVIEFSCP